MHVGLPADGEIFHAARGCSSTTGIYVLRCRFLPKLIKYCRGWELLIGGTARQEGRQIHLYQTVDYLVRSGFICKTPIQICNQRPANETNHVVVVMLRLSRGTCRCAINWIPIHNFIIRGHCHHRRKFVDASCRFSRKSCRRLARPRSSIYMFSFLISKERKTRKHVQNNH